MRAADTAKAARRVLVFLARQPARTSEAAGAGSLLLTGHDGAVIGADRRLLDRLVRGRLAAVADSRIAITAAGRRFLEGAREQADALGSPPAEIERATLVRPDGAAAVLVNAAESPLGQLARRKGRDGRPFLSAREFEAGERLRADYERGCIVPRIGMNWSGMGLPASGGRSPAGAVELGDAAMAARRRVDDAVDAVGPELAGPLIDVCCFLKGFERVEAERGWPVRSAKVVLKAALAALDRHYRPTEAGRAAGRGSIVHWGSADYRPAIRSGEAG